MPIVEILLTFLGLGIPVLALTWYMFGRLYQAGELERGHTGKALGQSLKELKAKNKAPETRSKDFLHNRWMRFGGGFYGLTALWTFAVIEALDLTGFIWNFPGFAALFADGVISFLVDVFTNQITNFVSAMVWFTYWGGDGGSIFVTFFIAYGAYLAGLKLAREDVTPEKESLLAFISRRPRNSQEDNKDDRSGELS